MAKLKRGFAAMDPQRAQEIIAMGTAAAAVSPNRYKWTPQRAREAARKSWANRRKGEEA